MYYVSIKPRRKNVRWHIQESFETFILAFKYVKQYSDYPSKYTIKICDERRNIVYKAGVEE